MTRATDTAADRPTVRRGELGWVVGIGVLVGGLAAVLVALFLPTTPARAGFPSWVWVTTVALFLVCLQAVAGPMQPESQASVVARRGWAVALGLGAAVLGWWAVRAGITDIQTGLPGPAVPLLAVGCVAVLVAAVLLAVTPPAHLHRGSVVRQALPAAIALVTVVAVAGVAKLAALRWIPVDATTAERVDPAAVPDQPAGVRWTWPTSDRLRGVVAAGAGVIVAANDGIVALDGPTGAERWHHRWVGADVRDIAATPDGRTAVAEVRAGGQPSTAVFAFDADTGAVRWSRQPGFRLLLATDHVLVRADGVGTLVGVDLGDGEDVWSWRLQQGCEFRWSRPSPDAVLSVASCRSPAGDTSNAVIGVDDRSGTQRWRFASTAAADPVEYHPFLDTSPDGRAAVFALSTKAGKQKEPVLLESATGAVVYRPDGDADIVAPDLRTPLLRRAVPGAEPRLVMRDLSTGAEHPLESACSDFLAVTPRSILSACLGEWQEDAAQRATVEVYSRSDGTPAASITATNAVRTISLSTSPPRTELIPAPGAIALAVQSFPDRRQSVVVGLA